MRVYLAAPYEKKAVMADRRKDLFRHGIECTSRWIDEVEVRTCEAEHWREIAVRDANDLADADVFVIDVTDKSPRGGMNVEYGMAWQLGKPIILVGLPCSHFHYLAEYVCQTWEQALGVLDALRHKESKE